MKKRAMPLIALLAAVAVTSTAVAQEAAPPPAAVAEPERPATAEEAALEAKAEAFSQRMQAMSGELQAAITTEQEEAIMARYAPETEAFIAELDAFIVGQIAIAPDETTKAQMEAGRVQAAASIRGVPIQIRQGVARAKAAAATAGQAAPQSAPTATPQ